MADGDQITPEEYGSWIQATDAIERVSKAMDNWDIAAAAILRRLNADELRAHIKSGTVEQSGKTEKLKTFVAVPKVVMDVWDSSQLPGTLQFWTSNDATVWRRMPGRHGYSVDQTWRLFGIRFDPAGIAELIPSAAAAPAKTNNDLVRQYGYATVPPPPPGAGTGASATVAKPEVSPLKRVSIATAAPTVDLKTAEKKPVSTADLARWAKVFVGVHTDFTGDFAQRSAAAMFRHCYSLTES